MGESDRKGQRLVALFLLGCLLFNYPVLALFNVPGALFGMPVALRLHLRRLGAADRADGAGRSSGAE